MQSFEIQKIVEAVKGKITQEKNVSMSVTPSDVCISSIDATLDSMFFAIIGENQDGHKYINDAIKNGARYIVYSNDNITYKENVVYIQVEDTLEALKNLAKAYRESKRVKVIGVTGSVGKTTTKDMIASCLSAKYKVSKTRGNLNSETGVPLTILSIKDTDEICVCEMGMDHIHEIYETSSIAMPDITCITNIGISHMEILKTKENILEAKLEIVQNQKLGGDVILNADDELLNKLNNSSKSFLHDKKLHFVGKNKGECRARVEKLDLENEKINISIIDEENKECTVQINGVSEHLVYHCAYAYEVAKLLEMDIELIKQGLENYSATPMRMQLFNLRDNILLISDTYNACPLSMKSAIDVSLKYENKKKYFILGDMLELGDNTANEHIGIAKYILDNYTDNIQKVYFIGQNMKPAFDAYALKKDNAKYYENKEQIGEINMENDSVVLIKASRKFKFETICEKLIEKYKK